MGHQSTQDPRTGGTVAADLGDPSLYLNQELSWLAFNRRVLGQAGTADHPMLERVKFLAIAAANLDEFFMVRVASLARHVRAGIFGLSADGRNAEQQLEAAREGGRQMLEEIAGCWRDTLRPLLEDECIRVLEPRDYSGQVRDYLRGYFNANICPVLTPLAFDPGHPFPFISNRSKNFAVVVEHDGQTKFARVKVPDVLPRFVRIPSGVSRLEGHTFAFVEDIIEQHIGELFTGVDVTGAHLFRVVREVDIVHREDDAEDLLESVGRSLRELRDADVALLEVDASMPDRILEILVENFEMPDEGLVVRSEGRLGLADWAGLTQVHRPRLKDAPFTPRALWRTRDTELVFDQIKDRDHLVHHPFDSFTSFETFIEAAVRDPHVVAIKMTLYRIGAFLEHSRVYYFENDGKEELYIGSADLMERNLDWRVEVLCPILDAGLRRLVRYQILDVYLDDNVRAFELRADGTYEPVVAKAGDRRVDAQQILMRRPRRGAPRTTHSI